MENYQPLPVRCCIWFVHPVTAPVSNTHLVMARIITILLIFFSMTGALISLIVPAWKIETFDDRSIEFSVWQICKVTVEESPIVQCFKEFYTGEDVEDWFYVWRYMMVISCCIQLLVFSSIIVIMAYKGNNAKTPWVIASWSCLLAGLLTFCALIVFHIKFEFGFAEGAHILMGWTEETDIEEILGYPYIISWTTVFTIWISGFLCYYMKCVEHIYFCEKDIEERPVNGSIY